MNVPGSTSRFICAFQIARSRLQVEAEGTALTRFQRHSREALQLQDRPGDARLLVVQVICTTSSPGRRPVLVTSTSKSTVSLTPITGRIRLGAPIKKLV